MSEQTKMIPSLVAQLNKDLAKLDSSNIDRLANMIVGVNIGCSIHILAESMLKAKLPVGTVQVYGLNMEKKRSGQRIRYTVVLL